MKILEQKEIIITFLRETRNAENENSKKRRKNGEVPTRAKHFLFLNLFGRVIINKRHKRNNKKIFLV